MIEDAIVGKLREVLSGSVDTECKVVYVLAETRKLLSKYQAVNKPITLMLCCHWALHVDLHGEGTILPFLERVDRYAASVLAGNNNVPEETKMLREFVYLESFRNEFKEFLRGFDLPSAICDDDQRWHEFLKNYAGVIEDGTLSCRDEKPSLKTIRSVVFRRGASLSDWDTYRLPFALAWTIYLLNGRRLTIEVNSTVPKDTEFIAFSTVLH